MASLPSGSDPIRPTRRAPVAAIQALVVLGGTAALSWEVVWQLRASLAFGVSALGTALTLAATMAGMTAGSLVAGAWLRERSVSRPLRLYGVLELVIGISGLLSLPGFALLELLDARVYALAPAFAPGLHALGMVLLIAPATFAMGATVPVFQLVARSFRTSVSALYAMNTAGAAAGVLLLSFWILPSLGVKQSCGLVAAANAAIFLLSRVPTAGAAAPARAESPSLAAEPRLSPAVAQLVVVCTGFATFGLEVAWFRALRAAFWSTSSSFAIMLAAVLVPLAVGARLVPWLRRRGASPGAMLACAGILILVATPFVERMDLMARIPGTYHQVLVIWFLISLVAIGPAVLFLATALPWCLEEYPEPGMTGRLYGLNTLGSVAGSLLAAWALLPALGFARSAWVLALLVGAVAFAIQAPQRRWRVAAAAGAALLFAAALTSSPGRDRMQGLFDFGGNRILAHEEGPDFTTSVVETPGRVRILFIDGFAATSQNRRSGHYIFWMGSLPAILHPQPERGLVICFGTGQTANALRREQLSEIDLVDVSQSVFDLAPFFESNEGVLEDSRTRAITMDGRAWLRRSDRRYDVVTLEPMPPNFSGVNSLYSREFYEIMARRLEPGGVVAQWFPIHLLTPPHATSVAATFRAVFPDALLWYDPIGGSGILVGRREGAPDPLGSRWPGLERSVTRRNLSNEHIRRGVLLDPAALARYASASTLITDDNQLLQFGQLLRFGQMRPGLGSGRGRRLTRENLAILSDAAGREPFRLPSRSQTGGPRM
jgi:predicted membrane-bound spermidine synthase